jgi:hypothetical protein
MSESSQEIVVTIEQNLVVVEWNSRDRPGLLLDLSKDFPECETITQRHQ